VRGGDGCAAPPAGSRQRDGPRSMRVLKARQRRKGQAQSRLRTSSRSARASREGGGGAPGSVGGEGEEFDGADASGASKGEDAAFRAGQGIRAAGAGLRAPTVLHLSLFTAPIVLQAPAKHLHHSTSRCTLQRSPPPPTGPPAAGARSPRPPPRALTRAAHGWGRQAILLHWHALIPAAAQVPNRASCPEEGISMRLTRDRLHGLGGQAGAEVGGQVLLHGC
jgi:hypothetical protein